MRLPAFVMIIAALVTVIEMLMRAFTFELYEILYFYPDRDHQHRALGRADAFASKNPVLPSLLDGFMMGAGFPGHPGDSRRHARADRPGHPVREHAVITGLVASDWRLEVFPDYPGFPPAVLPPGAFIGLGLIIAGRTLSTGASKPPAKPGKRTSSTTSRRVRTTGKVS